MVISTAYILCYMQKYLPISSSYNVLWECIVVNPVNPRRACAARVTVVVAVCLCVCLSLKSHLTLAGCLHLENAATYSAGDEGQNICGVFSETVSFQSYDTSCIVRLPCSRPFSLVGIRACYNATLTVGRSLVCRRRPQVL